MSRVDEDGRTPRVPGAGWARHLPFLELARSGQDPGGRAWERDAEAGHITATDVVLRAFTTVPAMIRVYSGPRSVEGLTFTSA